MLNLLPYVLCAQSCGPFCEQNVKSFVFIKQSWGYNEGIMRRRIKSKFSYRWFELPNIHLGCFGGSRPQKNLTAKVHPKYVKCWGFQIKTTRILILFANALYAISDIVGSPLLYWLLDMLKFMTDRNDRGPSIDMKWISSKYGLNFHPSGPQSVETLGSETRPSWKPIKTFVIVSALMYSLLIPS